MNIHKDKSNCQLDKIEEVLLTDAKLRRRLARFILAHDYVEADEITRFITHAELVCTAAFGSPVKCPVCGANVRPSFECWGCDKWTAPESKP